MPQRLTHHPGETIMPGGTPDYGGLLVILGQIRDTLVESDVWGRRFQWAITQSDKFKSYVRKGSSSLQNLVEPVELRGLHGRHVD
jgi:hypothetical protein